MQGYYETKTEVSENHQLTVTLPDDIPPRPAKLNVIDEMEGTAISDKEKRRARMPAFLANLPINTTGGLSRGGIRDHSDEQHQVRGE